MPKKTAYGFFLQRKTRAVFLLWLILLGIQCFLFYSKKGQEESVFMLDTALQQAIEEQKKVSSSQKIYPFNPNFISDSKGYYLSLSVDQIDRLHRYRSQGKWVNSANDFQQVTGVSETWMNQYAPYFKFPFHKRTFNSKKKLVQPQDLNTVSAEDLIRIKGIGEVLSKRIVKYRQRLKGYTTIDQLDEVYGLDVHVLGRLKERFSIQTQPVITKLDINFAGLYALSKLPYLTQSEAKKIILTRTQHGKINWDHIKGIEGFDSLKIKRLTLYLF